MIFNVGRVCVKLAGRDAGKTCVIVETVNSQYVVVDGATRRKKVNIQHLEPLANVIDIKEKATHSEVAKAFEKLGIKAWETKKKTVAAKPKKQKVKKEEVVSEKKAVKAKPAAAHKHDPNVPHTHE